MHRYLFFLGHQPHISTAEIKAVFSALDVEYEIERKTDNHLFLETKDELDAEELMKRLGGTVKISKQLINQHPSPLPPARGELEGGYTSPKQTIIHHLIETQPTGKIQFSLTDKKIGLEIKKQIKATGRNIRYIEPKNTATILHNNLVKKQGDFNLISDNVYVTVAIQPIEELGARDYGRPGHDSESGMLPPKLAKIMINLAEQDEGATLLDPFCGSGTVLMEAAVMGYKNLIGSDISEKATADSKKNLSWVQKKFQISNFKFQIFEHDAKKIDEKLEKNSVDFVVTEPYLGKPLRGNETEVFLRAQADELLDLYTEFFRSLAKILKPNGQVVMVIPSFKFQKNFIQINEIDNILFLKELKKIGFEPTPFENKEFLRYHRPAQHVARDIWRFKKI